MTRTACLALLAGALGLAACATSPPPAPENTDRVDTPRGAALERAVIGTWLGVAHDGSETTENVEVTLSDDGTFNISAGLVHEANKWVVRDDLVALLPDPESAASDGLCFRPTRVTDGRIEGKWAYTADAVPDAGPVSCKDEWYVVTLDRRR